MRQWTGKSYDEPHLFCQIYKEVGMIDQLFISASALWFSGLSYGSAWEIPATASTEAFVDNQMTAPGPSLDGKFSLSQAVIVPEGIEFIFTVYNCSSVNRHFSHQSIFRYRDDFGEQAAEIKANMLPIITFALEHCGLPAKAYSFRNFDEKFIELSNAYRETQKAELKVQRLKPDRSSN